MSYKIDLDKILGRDEWYPVHSMYKCRPREIWFPLSAAVGYWDESFHEVLLNDHVRMAAFTKAIASAMLLLAERAGQQKVIRILDIGTGTGVWAYLCWKYLSEHSIPAENIRIYALEANPKTFEGLTRDCLTSREIAAIYPCNVVSADFVEYVRFHRKNFKKFDPELVREFSKGRGRARTQLFDAIICECIGGIGDEEGIIEIMQEAVRTLRRADGLLIPNSLDIFAVPVVEDPEDTGSIYYQLQTFLSSKNDDEASEGDQTVRTVSATYKPSDLVDDKTPMLDVVIPNNAHACEPMQIHTLDFTRPDSLRSNYHQKCPFKITAEIPAGHRITGFKLYFKAKLFVDGDGLPILLDISGDQVSGHTNRASDCWKHTFLPLNFPIATNKGDVLTFSLERELTGQKSAESELVVPVLKYTWEGTNSGSSNVTRAGEFSIRHDILVNRSAQYKVAQFGLFDIYRNVGLLSDIVLALCVTELFGLAMGAHGGSDHDSLSYFDRALIGGIAALLIRIVHSFALLVMDAKFAHIEYEAFLKLSTKRQVVRIGERIGLAFGAFVFVLAVNNPLILSWLGIVINRTFVIAVAPFLVFAFLYLWDRAALAILDERIKQVGQNPPRWSSIVRQAVQTWVRLDKGCLYVTFIGIVALFVLDRAWHRGDESFHIGWPNIMIGVQLLAASLLLGSFVYDYWKNAEFYSGRLKEEHETHIRKLL